MADFVAILMFLIRAIVLTGVIVLFLVFSNSFFLAVNTETTEKTAAEAANIIMESDLAASRGVFNLEKIRSLDGSDEELVRNCNKGIRYEFYTINESGKQNRWSFGFLNEDRFRSVELSKTSFSKDYNVWLKDGDALLQAKLRIIVFDFELARFTCAAENALAKNSIESTISCEAQSMQLQRLSGPASDVIGNCEIFAENGKICMNIRARAVPVNPRAITNLPEEKICRKSTAEFLGEREEIDIDPVFGFRGALEIKLEKNDLRNSEDKGVVGLRE